jgi:hypothetical protein
LFFSIENGFAMPDATDLAPWAHPKAKRWFHSLIEDNSFALALEDELVQAEQVKDYDRIRMIHALALLLGHEGIWPKHRTAVLKACVRASSQIVKDHDTGPVGGPLTISEHKGQSATDEAFQQEIELMRRRLKMSNRKSMIGPPKSWGNVWE